LLIGKLLEKIGVRQLARTESISARGTSRRDSAGLSRSGRRTLAEGELGVAPPLAVPFSTLRLIGD
jgi:hypothetical protein